MHKRTVTSRGPRLIFYSNYRYVTAVAEFGFLHTYKNNSSYIDIVKLVSGSAEFAETPAKGTGSYMSVKGTLNLELTVTVKNLQELVEKTEMLGKILKSGDLEIKFDGLERQSERSELLKPKVSETTTIPADDEQVSFTAKVMAFDDTFRSDDTDPIWGLAFTSKDIMQVKNIDEVLGKRQQVVITIRKVKEEGKTEDQGTLRSMAAQWHLKSKHDNEYVVSDTGKYFSIENAKGYTIMDAGYDSQTQREKTLDRVKTLMRDLGVSERDLKVIS